MFIIRSLQQSHARLSLSSGLGVCSGAAMFTGCVAGFASPRCQRDQAGLLDPAASGHAQLPAELERLADGSAAGGPVRSQGSERSLDCLRWGLIPHWSKDINVGFANINAKAEGIENRPAFRDALKEDSDCQAALCSRLCRSGSESEGRSG
jgi:hypothetical protein